MHSIIKLPETRIKIKANQEEQKVEGKRSYFDGGNVSQDSFDYDEEEMVPMSELKKLQDKISKLEKEVRQFRAFEKGM